MEAKVKILFAVLLLAGALCVSAFAVAAKAGMAGDGGAASCLAEESASYYVVKEYEGYVAVYTDKAPLRPLTVTDIQVSTLRELDRTLLDTGIKLYSRERLMMTLEDLGS